MRMQFTEDTENQDKDERPVYHYCLVGNIPITFHSADLRNYFATFIKEQKFNCFHFRHRPQFISINSNANAKLSIPDSSESGSSKDNLNTREEKKTFCALVRFDNDHYLNSFAKLYHGKYWMDRQGNELQGRCVVQKVRLSNDEIRKFSKELIPPRFMPHGNVGTTNEYFLELIRNCRLPPSLIKKLGLQFPPARRYKKYSKVPFDYGTDVVEEKYYEDAEEEVTTGKGHVLSDVALPKTNLLEPDRNVDEALFSRNRNDESEDDDNPNADDDNCESWERHEALHNDVTSQERSSERLYEEEIELVWEKGGPGIVWYTDAQYWDALEGGFDEKTSDDLDIDMQGYYEEGAGDKDARDLIDIRRSERFKKGLERISVFRKRRSRSPESPARTSSATPDSSQANKRPSTSWNSKTIGKFEAHTKGFGRKLMEKQGWEEGTGLGGSSNLGMPEALENDGQNPKDRRGFGYYGEKLEFSGKPKRPKHSNANNPYGLDEDDRVIIATIYDKPADVDKEEPLLRSNAPTFIKRHDFVRSRTN